MISYQQVFDEIDRQLQGARTTTDLGAIREALSAIRSLSEVALGAKGEQPVAPKIAATPQVMSQPQVQPQVQSLASMDGKLLKEEDGSNGESLFDF